MAASCNETCAAKQLVEQLRVLAKEAGQPDVKVGHVRAHKAILCTASQYFKTLFSSYRNEKKIRHCEIVEIPRDEMDALCFITPWLYGSSYDFTEIHANDIVSLKNLLDASHVLQANVIFEWCYKKLVRMDCKSFFEMYYLAEKYGDKGMIKHVVSFLIQNFCEIAEYKEFLKLNTQQMTKIFQEYGTVDLIMEDVLQGLLRWAEAENVCEGREETLLLLVSALDLQFLSTEFLTELLRNPTIKKNNHLLLLFHNEAMLRLLPAVKTNEPKPKFMVIGKYRTTPSTCRWYRDEISKNLPSSLRIYDIWRNQWSEPKVLPFRLEESASVAWFDGCIYVFGEETLASRPKASTKIIRYCPTTNAVSSCQSVEIPVVYPNVVVLGNSIYIMGGSETENPLKKIQRYNPLTNTCEVIKSKRNFEMHSDMFTSSEFLYVIGTAKPQENNDKCQFSIERYDPKTDAWTVVTTVPGEMYWFEAAICHERFIVVPVETSGQVHSCHIYNLSLGTWDEKKFKEDYFNLNLKLVTTNGKYALLIHHFDGNLKMYDVDSGEMMKRSPSSVEIHCRNHFASM